MDNSIPSRHIRGQSQKVVNQTDFWTSFSLPNFKEAVPPKKLHPRYHRYLAARQAKFTVTTLQL